MQRERQSGTRCGILRLDKTFENEKSDKDAECFDAIIDEGKLLFRG